METEIRGIFKEYESLREYKESLNLFEKVKRNENFFIGRQWEGVRANGLPTPVINFIKRVTLFVIASNTSDKLEFKATVLSDEKQGRELAEKALNSELKRIAKSQRLSRFAREFFLNAAVDGDAASYSFWEDGPDGGEIRTELIRNTRIYFGNSASREVQSQPFIIIERLEETEKLRERARLNGEESFADIAPEPELKNLPAPKTRVLLKLFKQDGEVYAVECVKNSYVRRPWALGLRRYPVTYMSWDYIRNSCHGEALVSSLIPNQVFVNKLFAMSLISLSSTAFPKIIYDKTRIESWDNGVGKAIGVFGGGVEGVAKAMAPAEISPQISEFIRLSIELSQAAAGATGTALGEGAPYNTSAILALQKAAATSNEFTKQNLYDAMEDLGHIYLDFLAGYMGEKTVEGERFDFGEIREPGIELSLDVGASAYWSELGSVSTLNALLAQNKIGIEDYLKRIPDELISDRQGLLEDIAGREAAFSIK